MNLAASGARARLTLLLVVAAVLLFTCLTSTRAVSKLNDGAADAVGSALGDRTHRAGVGEGATGAEAACGVAVQNQIGPAMEPMQVRDLRRREGV